MILIAFHLDISSQTFIRLNTHANKRDSLIFNTLMQCKIDKIHKLSVDVRQRSIILVLVCDYFHLEITITLCFHEERMEDDGSRKRKLMSLRHTPPAIPRIQSCEYLSPRLEMTLEWTDSLLEQLWRFPSLET